MGKDPTGQRHWQLQPPFASTFWAAALLLPPVVLFPELAMMVTAAWAGAAPEAVLEPPRPPVPLALEVPFEEPLPSARTVTGAPVAPAAAAEADEPPALVVFPVLLEAPLPSARTVMAAAADAPAAGVGDERPAAGAGEGPPFVGAGP